jgi:hypothetical protein
MVVPSSPGFPMTAARKGFDDWLAQHLRCPYEGGSLHVDGESIRCAAGHTFPVVRGIPVLLRNDVESTHTKWWTTPEQIEALRRAEVPPLRPGEIDPFVRRIVVWTCGLLYQGMRDPLPRYPIASLDVLPFGDGRKLLDVGGNWGRWALGAAGRGYQAVVVDPSLRAAFAGQRIADALGRDVRYVVADGRHLPFDAACFAVSFSYSVLQSLDKSVARELVREMARVTELNGIVRVQMANVFGLRRLTKGLADAIRDRVKALADPQFTRWPFRVRSWTLPEIRRCFTDLVGPTTVSVDGFFSLNAQPADADPLRRRYAAVIHASRVLVGLSRVVPPLAYVADSLYAEAKNTRGAPQPL